MLVYHQESWRKMASIIDLIIIYTMTIITSKAIYNKYDCKLSNDLADKGLKIKKETLNEIYINIKRHIIPIVNIITAIIMYKNYNKNKANIIEKLQVNNRLEPLSKWEKENYDVVNPNRDFTWTSYYYKERLKGSNIAKREAPEGTSKIYFIERKKGTEIVNAIGPISEKSREDPLTFIHEYSKDLADKLIKFRNEKTTNKKENGRYYLENIEVNEHLSKEGLKELKLVLLHIITNREANKKTRKIFRK